MYADRIHTALRASLGQLTSPPYLRIFATPKIGRALVSTHDYRRAVEYYRKALRGQPRSIPLRHDLAQLCLKLGRFEDASGVLRQVRTHVLLPDNRLDVEA